MVMAQSSSVQAQGPALRDVENGIVEEPDAPHSGSAPPSGYAPQQTPLQRSASQQLSLLLQRFDKEVYPPVEDELKWYDARERELEVKYRQELKARKEREAREEERKKSQARQPRLPSEQVQEIQPVQERQAREPQEEEQARELDEEQLGPLPDYDDYCYKEIENLVLIERSLIHRKALEEWDRKEKLFTSRVDRKSKKVGNLKNEVYQLIGFFSVFQGVVLTAVAQSNLLHCNNLWSPIVLSALASVVTILAVEQKLSQISSFQTTISAEERSLRVAVHRGASLRKAGKAFVFMRLGNGEVQQEKEHSQRYNVIVLSFLIFFTLGFPLSHWRILCHPGPSPYDQSPGA